MSHEHQRAITDALRDLPLTSRLAHLLWSVTVDDNAALSVEMMLELTLIAARHLEPTQKAAVSWHLANAIAELDEVKWQ